MEAKQIEDTVHKRGNGMKLLQVPWNRMNRGVSQFMEGSNKSNPYVELPL